MSYPIHHDTVEARLAPEEPEQGGRFDILETSDGNFKVYEQSFPVGEATTLKGAVRIATSKAAEYDRGERARRKRLKEASRQADYVMSVNVAVTAGSPVEATAKAARALAESPDVKSWHFRTFASGKGIHVTLPRRAPAGAGTMLDALAPVQGLLTPALRAAIDRLVTEVEAHVDYESDPAMEGALEDLKAELATAETPTDAQ